METASIKKVVSLNDIEKFLEPKKIALAGASRNPKKFGGTVLAELTEKGYEVYPVNPNATELLGRKCYASVSDLPQDVRHLLIVTPKNQTTAVAAEAVTKGMEMVWIQQMSDVPEAVKMLEEAGVQVITKKCILMFAGPVEGPHKFHRFLVKLFGFYPKRN